MAVAVAVAGAVVEVAVGGAVVGVAVAVAAAVAVRVDARVGVLVDGGGWVGVGDAGRATLVAVRVGVRVALGLASMRVSTRLGPLWLSTSSDVGAIEARVPVAPVTRVMSASTDIVNNEINVPENRVPSNLVGIILCPAWLVLLFARMTPS
jgi:hypothetical protein